MVGEGPRGDSTLLKRFFFDLRRGSAALTGCDRTALVGEAAGSFAKIKARASSSTKAFDGVIDPDHEIVLSDARRLLLEVVTFGGTLSICQGKPARTSVR